MSRKPIRASIRTRGEDDGHDGPSRELVRTAFSLRASAVAIVTVRLQGRVHGLTVSAFTSLSLDPPLVLVCIHEQAPLLTYLLDAQRFTINVLADDQRRIASMFSDSMPVGQAPFPEHGDPMLPGALASLACDLHATHAGGDHRIIVGRVGEVAIGERAPGALLHYRSEYHTLG